jgi:hypothetical protein
LRAKHDKHVEAQKAAEEALQVPATSLFASLTSFLRKT